MVNKRYHLHDPKYNSPFNSLWTNSKHAKAQVNGQTMQTQPLIVLAVEAKKRSH